jgi:hypothetical protein
LKQLFTLKIELPDGWLLNTDTLKRMIEEKTIFDVLEIAPCKSSSKQEALP